MRKPEAVCGNGLIILWIAPTAGGGYPRLRCVWCGRCSPITIEGAGDSGLAVAARRTGEVMKKVILGMLFIGVLGWAQDKSQVTVKSANTTNGMVFVTLTENGKRLELQCTESQAWCTELKAGDYQMLRLRKNHGMYDCQNVDLFSSGANVENDQKLGEYCLNDAS